MAHKDRIYRKSSPVKTILVTLMAILLAVVIFMVIIFFSFQKYITYTSDGVRLEVPWLMETSRVEE